VKPPYLKRQAARPVGAAGVRSERRLAKQLGARLQPASGARAGAKGDAQLAAVLLEVKSTVAASMVLKLDWLAKITREARAVHCTPVLAVNFTLADGRPVADGQWVLMPLSRWQELTDERARED
jgi:hypothetical protein